MKVDYYLLPVTGHVVLKNLTMAVSKANPGQAYRFTVHTNFKTSHFEGDNIPANQGPKNDVIAKTIQTLHKQRSFLNCTNVSIASLAHGVSISYTEKDGESFANIAIHGADSGPAADLVVGLAEQLSKLFSLGTRATVILDAFPKAVSEQLAAAQQATTDHTVMVAHLEEVVARQFEDNQEYLRKHTAELDEAHKKKDADLDDRINARAEELAKAEEEFQRKLDAFETQESKYVRRDLLKRMEQLIEKHKTITLSTETTGKRTRTHSVSLGVVATCLLAGGYFAYKLYQKESPLWQHFVPLSSIIALLVATVVYYFRWLNQWATVHAQAEFRNMRFAADILRANWLAELLFEWETEKDRDFPEALIEHFTKNLFQDEKMTATDHPAEQLGKLLSQITSFKVDQAGVEIKKAGDKSK